MTLDSDLRAMMPGVGYRTRSVDLIGGSDGWRETASGILVPARQRFEGPTAVDLFAGAGGFSLGMHQAGWHVVGAADGWAVAAETYLCNLGSPDTVVHVLPPAPDTPEKWVSWHEEHLGSTVMAGEFFEACRERKPKKRRKANDRDTWGPGTGWISSSREHEPGSCAEHIEDPGERIAFCDGYHASPVHRGACLHYFLGDIRHLTGEILLDALDLDIGELSGIVGGPPCQGFSSAGKRDVMDPRNSLVFEFARIVLEARPRTMVMENVPAMLSMVTPEGIPIVDALCRMLEDGEYGTFDSLKRALTQQAGAAGTVRSRPKRHVTEPDPLEQQELFA